MVHRYLHAGEVVLYRTPEFLTINDEYGYIGVVTSERVLFVRRNWAGHDHVLDVYLRDIMGTKGHDTGLLWKRKTLTLKAFNTEVKLWGRLSTVNRLHETIHQKIRSLRGLSNYSQPQFDSSDSRQQH